MILVCGLTIDLYVILSVKSPELMMPTIWGSIFYLICTNEISFFFRHEVRWNTLDKYPTSRLGRLRHCVTHRGQHKHSKINIWWVLCIFCRDIRAFSRENFLRNELSVICCVLRCFNLYMFSIRAGLQQICDSYSLERREYYFDRSPRNFDAILCLYRKQNRTIWRPFWIT